MSRQVPESERVVDGAMVEVPVAGGNQSLAGRLVAERGVYVAARRPVAERGVDVAAAAA